MAGDIPPLPPGFTLDKPAPAAPASAVPPLPPGFTLDKPEAKAAPTAQKPKDDRGSFEKAADAVFPPLGLRNRSGDTLGGALVGTAKQLAEPSVEGAKEGGRRALGVGENEIYADEGRSPIRPLSDQTTNAAMALGGLRAPGAIGRAARGVGETIAPGPRIPPMAPEARRTMMLTDRANHLVSGAWQKGEAGGAPSALDTITELGRAREAGQPLALIDVPNQPVQKLAGEIYRRGGEGASQIRSFLENRQAGQLGRTENLINTRISDKPLAATGERLKQERSERAQPIWAEVKRGGSIAPLEHQFGEAFDAATKAEAQARDVVRQANVEATQAAGRQATTGVAEGGAARAGVARGQVDVKLQAARAALDQTKALTAQMRERLQQAQADGSANAPGAIWSPRLQQFLDQPEVRQGIQRGWNIERRNAVGEGRPFNAHEYAVVGEENGAPIVGKVPNMALLMVAKEGLDAIIEQRMQKARFGRPDKVTSSYMTLKNGLLEELDRLSPNYKAARDVWAGDSANLMALGDGGQLLGTRRFSTIEEASDHYAKLSESERESFKIGLAADLKNRLFRGRTISNEDIKRRLRPLFKSDQEATDFVDSIQRERTMEGTQKRIQGRAPGAADDVALSQQAVQAAHSIGEMIFGGWRGKMVGAWRMKKLLGERSDPALDLEMSKLLTNPTVRGLPGAPGDGAKLVGSGSTVPPSPGGP